MNTTILIFVLVMGNVFLLLEIVFAHIDGTLTRNMMIENSLTFDPKKYGYSLFQHGGRYGNFFVMTPAVAGLAATYHFTFIAVKPLLFLAIIAYIWNFLRIEYKKSGLITPEADTYDNKTTAAGWSQMIYAIIAIWFISLFYFTPVVPHASVRDICIVTVALSVYFPLGVVKFRTHGHWRMTRAMWLQVIGEIAAVWIIALIKIYY